MGYRDYERGYQDGRSSTPKFLETQTPAEVNLYLFIAYLLGILFCYLVVQGGGYSMWWMLLSPFWPIILLGLIVVGLISIPFDLLF